MSKETIVGVIEDAAVHTLLAEASARIGAVGKHDRNTHQGFAFRGIDAVVNAVGPVFRELGIVPVPVVGDVAYEVVETGAKRTPMTACRVRVSYAFYGPRGDYLVALVAAEAFDSGDKATAKAMSVAFRTALLQVLCLPTDEPDPDSHTYERAPARDEGELRQAIADCESIDGLRALWPEAHAAGLGGLVTERRAVLQGG